MRKLVICILACSLAAIGAGSSTSSVQKTSRPLQTAVYLSDAGSMSPSTLRKTLTKVRSAGAAGVRVMFQWSQIAPAKRAPTFKPQNPADPGYRWADTDRVIKAIARAGLQPLLTFYYAPTWAGGPAQPKPDQFGLFATAAAKRYSGSFHGLPRVKYWLAWNEPNLSKYLYPQYSNNVLVSAANYRDLVNAFADSVHAVHSNNVVVAGLLAPVKTPYGVGARKFMRTILCVSSTLHATCHKEIDFDVWSVHPYTSGGPTHKSSGSDGATLGNMPEVAAILQTAVRARTVVSSQHVALWVTEFSWDSKPPDPLGVPADLEARWVSEALWRCWQSGVTMFTWFALLDEPLHRSPFQSGLYQGTTIAKAKPKLALSAFHFPFIAVKRGSAVSVWGRTPDSKHHTLWIERQVKHRWVRVGRVSAGSNGIFSRTFRLRDATSKWLLRAHIVGTRQHSLGFSLKKVPDKYYVPFGS